MSRPRFYCPNEFPASGIFTLEPGVRHHAYRVLRVVHGEEILLFDGKGNEARCKVLDDSSVVILEKHPVDRESRIGVHLVQALVASEKMDWVVQKAVELGAKSVQIVETKRGVVRLSGDRAKKRQAHWLSVAISACEQCGRNRIPDIPQIAPLESWLSAKREGVKYLLSPSGKSLKHFSPAGEIFILVGPEGGLAPEEESLASAAGFEALGLGPRILRTETAGLAAISAMQAIWGDFSQDIANYL